MEQECGTTYDLDVQGDAAGSKPGIQFAKQVNHVVTSEFEHRQTVAKSLSRIQTFMAAISAGVSLRMRSFIRSLTG